MSDGKLKRKVSSITVVAIGLGTILLSIACLYVAAKVTWFATHPTWQKILQDLSSAIFVTGLLSLLWELFARRAVVAEVLGDAGVSDRVVKAGLSDVTADFLNDVDWKALFEGTRELDLFFAYGGSWRGNHIEQIRDVNRRRAARIRVVLPDFDDDDTVSELARRFGFERSVVVDRIKESVKSFQDLATAPGAKASIKVFLLAKTPVYSFYRFDDVALAALYHHKGMRATVPALTIKRGHSLFAFFESDIGAIMDGKIPGARIVFKKP